MFNKILIANRSEIAVRIIRACRELGIKTVAVCSEADRSALHSQIADECVCIGPASSKESYLNMRSIIAACEITGADAIHPGFGFLSENSRFARMCESCNITFIGPSPESIEALGDKAAAKKTMKGAGVPVIPGSDGAVETKEEALEIARRIKFPVVIKASAGGGGRGIRIVHDEKQFERQLVQAKQEALTFFGNDEIYVEKFVENPRHVEIQILGDKSGNIVHLGERDCSMQRRNQKVLEEAPSPAVTPEIRAEMGEAAVRAAKAAGYYSAGTVEFLFDPKTKEFYFMEMNTRIQVEHPVTEMVTGVDIVKQQILVAAGKCLEFAQKDVEIKGHSIECRINAETPELDFRPSPGKITALYMPGGPGVRIDSAIYAGYSIVPHYDSMIAKLITYAPTRHEAIAKMRWALAEFLVEGIDTNIDFQLDLIKTAEFESGEYNTATIGRLMDRNGGGPLA